MLYENERLEELRGGVRAIVCDEYTFGADAVLLASFVAPSAGQKLCELGTGCGVIPLLWCRNGARFAIDAFELQPQAAGIARRAAALNGIDCISIINADMRAIDSVYNNSYDVVVCNPPYKPNGTGARSKSTSALLARHEVGCTLEDVISAAQKLLCGKGRLCLCHRPERLADIITLMRKYHIEPKRLRFVQQNVKKRPWLVLIEGKKSARPSLEVMPALLVEENGEMTTEMCRIYGI